MAESNELTSKKLNSQSNKVLSLTSIPYDGKGPFTLRLYSDNGDAIITQQFYGIGNITKLVVDLSGAKGKSAFDTVDGSTPGGPELPSPPLETPKSEDEARGESNSEDDDRVSPSQSKAPVVRTPYRK